MIFKTLGTLDFIAVLVVLGAVILPQQLLFVAGLYLIIKGGIFIYESNDFASYGDLVCGIYLLILAMGVKIAVIHPIVLVYLAQKVIITFVAIGVKASLHFFEYKRKKVPSYEELYE